MSYTLSGVITGAAATGFTSPTYTVTADTPPAPNAKQWAVTAIGGTQTGVDVHSVSKPFTQSVFKPIQLRSLPQVNTQTGMIKNVPVNTYKMITRKGAAPAANQMPLVPRMYTVLEIPAGTDTYEPEDLKAMISMHIGSLNANAAGIGDMAISGIM